MRIAMPVQNGRLCEHFGHAPQFAIFAVDTEQKRIESEQVLDAPPHEPGVLPAWLSAQKVDVVLTGGMGMRAQQLFAEQGMRVVTGVSAAGARETVEAYLAGTLAAGGNVCDHPQRGGRCRD
ncbi:MAG: NifB/NifX family molybdenum-iron cluster-binding protein [Planctomycetes bacterium]|nr:NifB/NifX family molybdenum-iron cluster-binding protein [Planctomycetota bacterium]